MLPTQASTPEEQQEAISWFKREVSTLLTLEHPAIPAIHGYWTATRISGPFYLAMDYIPGLTLAEIQRQAGGPLPWPQVVARGIALCDVLHYLHSRTPPFVFRDLKLSNIIVDSRTNTPVLIDFGIARQLATGDIAIGTWGYVPMDRCWAARNHAATSMPLVRCCMPYSQAAIPRWSIRGSSARQAR